MLCFLTLLLITNTLAHKSEDHSSLSHSHSSHSSLSYYPSPPKDSSSTLQMFPLNQVSLNPGSPAYDGQVVNMEYLHLLDADRLLYNFMITAGLPSSAQPLGGWEDPTCQLRGHFVGMYLSASSKAYNSYGDNEQKQKGDYIVSQMYTCQQKMGTGYLSAFPSNLFDILEAQQEYVWAPYYTIHKIMQGLWDMYTLTGNQQAYEIVLGMADYFTKRIENVINLYTIYRWEQILQVEYGGMNDVMYQVYSVTGNSTHLWMAQMFDAGGFLGPLSMGQDWLTGLHANTHIPVVIGSARRYEIVGDNTGKTIAENFYDFVIHNRSYATGGHNGGNGSDVATAEHWGEPGKLALTLVNDNQEFCTTYNTLKLATHLIQWTADVEYMDFYERAYFNGVYGAQIAAKGPGVMLYFYPLATGFNKGESSQGWGTQNDSFWCCYATGVEQWAKMGEAIYFQSSDDTQLYVNLFVASTLRWTSKNITVTQKTTFPTQQGTTILINSQQSSSFTLNIHVPYWVNPSSSFISLNGVPIKENLSPSSLFAITRTWANGDIVNVSFPFTFHLHPMNDDPNLVAIMYGPLVMAGLTMVPHTLPISNQNQLPSIMTPVQGNPLQFTAKVDSGNTQMSMQPLFTISTENYGVYWRLQPTN